MRRKVLVLNQDFSPITVCSVYRAFLLIYLDKAEMVSSMNGALLRTVSESYPMPSVIRINRYVSMPYRGVVLTRFNIFKRDKHKCQYCGTSQDLTLDHLVPKSKGGKSTWTNLVTACKRCNAKKGDFSPAEAGLILRKVPVKPSYVMFLREAAGSVRSEWLPYLDRKGVVSEVV